MKDILVAVIVIGVPAAAFTLWPLLGRGRPSAWTFLRLAPDAREELLERKRQIFRALRELDFEHDAGHISDADYAGLRTRYETEAAGVLSELDRLGHVAPPPQPRREPVRPRGAGAWRHPLAVSAAAVALLAFGVGIGAGIVKYTSPDPSASEPLPGSRPLASLEPPPPGGDSGQPRRAVSPEMLRGMLQAARSSLFAGRYSEAIAAYQAVLRRDPKNVDALTHMGLLVGIAGHTDTALETLDRALAIDPNYAPALLYRGQVLYGAKDDVAGAIKSWEKFLAVSPPGEERERVKRLIAEARARPAARPTK